MAIPEQNLGKNEAASARAEEEAYRQKIVTLRNGLRTLFRGKGMAMSAGTSNAELMNGMTQLRGKSHSQRSERLSASWSEEYQSLVHEVNTIFGSALATDSDPEAILQEIISRNGEAKLAS